MTLSIKTQIEWRRAVYEACVRELEAAKSESDKHCARMRIRRMLTARSPTAAIPKILKDKIIDCLNGKERPE